MSSGVISSTDVPVVGAPTMHIHIADIQPPDRYPCTLRQVNELFGTPPLTLLGFGWPQWTFVADPRCAPDGDLNGVVIASVTHDPELGVRFNVFPVHRDRFTDAAETELVTTILPRLRQHLDAELDSAASNGSRICQLILTWNGSEFRIHTAQAK